MSLPWIKKNESHGRIIFKILEMVHKNIPLLIPIVTLHCYLFPIVFACIVDLIVACCTFQL